MESHPHTAGPPLSCEALQEVIERLSREITRWEALLLAGLLPEFESCTKRQKELCRELGQLLSEQASRMKDAGPAASAGRAREQSLRFAAVLRRMRRNLITLRESALGVSRVYGRVEAESRL